MSSAATAKERLAFLDIARAMAALPVLASHCLKESLPGYSEWSSHYVNLGRLGVLLFLMVSGFIIPVSLEQGGSNPRFWLRRFFRLFPAYWLSIALAYAYCRCGGHLVIPVAELHGSDWLLNLTMLQGFFRRPHVLGVFWTLQLELMIYAAFSLLFASRLLGRSHLITVSVLTAYVALSAARPFLDGRPFGINGPSYIYLVPLMGLLGQACWAGKFGRRTSVALVVGLPLSLAGVWLVNHLTFPEEITADCLRELFLTWGVAYACFFLLLAAHRWPMPAAACRLGRISYSVYLLHPLVLALLLPLHWPVWGFLPTLLAASLAVSALAFRFVEEPGIALGRALERRWLHARHATQRLTPDPARGVTLRPLPGSRTTPAPRAA
jgi:peptidoglycan/LPS O-acetylase OafA/YrhL